MDMHTPKTSAGGSASREEKSFCKILKAPVFDGAPFNSAVFTKENQKKIRLVRITPEGQAEIKKVDLYEILDTDEKVTFKELFGRDTGTCLLKPGTFEKIQ